MTTVISSLSLTPEERSMIGDAGAERLVDLQAATGSDLQSAEVWFGPEFTRDVFNRMPGLKWVQATSAGVESWLFPEVVASDVTLTNVRGLHSDSVADLAMALVLAHVRSLPVLFDQQKRHEWSVAPGRELSGMTMTIVGVGAIGSQIGDRALVFGMDVIGVSRRNDAEVSDPRMRRVDISELRTALAVADWVVLALPITPETHHLIGRNELLAMKPTAVLVNVGRGPVVDEAALIEALATGTISGACLDVFEEEPLAADSRLWDMANVILTPHVAGFRTAFQSRAVALFCENLRRYRASEALRDQIDKTRGY